MEEENNDFEEEKSVKDEDKEESSEEAKKEEIKKPEQEKPEEKPIEETEKEEPHEVKQETKPEIVSKNKEAKKDLKSSPFSNKSAKEGSFMPLFLVMLASFVIAGLWHKVPAIKNTISAVLDPSAGALLNWNISWGMIILIFMITLITTLAQKYLTDQKTLRELKKEQKEIQKQMKEFRSHPEKVMELQKKQMALMPKQFKLSMRAIAYTGIPIILFFRWFYDFFATLGDVKFFGIIGSWFLFYLIVAIIIGSILRKILKVV